MDPLIESLRRAVAASPDDAPLRLHLARQLSDLGERDAAVAEVAAFLQRQPGNAEALAMLTAITGNDPAPDPPTGQRRTDDTTDTTQPNAAQPNPIGFDWTAAEADVDGIVEPAFVSGEPAPAAFDTERPAVTLADVGGLDEVKERLDAAFLTPLRNPELRALYRSSLRGGMLLYGPPGCGKTFLARAMAGELGASFISVGITDVLDPYIGNSERNVREAFRQARLTAPCVLFFDEIDALGHRRSSTRNDALRGTVNQLLTELDGIDDANDGVFVLAATNQPWDVDPAMRRPGRFDRTVLVLPPDAPAREAIFRHHLEHRPVEGVDTGKLADRSEGFSGADIAYVCRAATERALLDGARTGTARMIRMNDLEAALHDHRPSIGSWLESARNVVLFADPDGEYDELRRYLKRTKRL